MEKKDVTLLVIDSASDEGISPVQLQKSLFIVGQSNPPDLPADFYVFSPYNYGPFSVDVYHDADDLVKEGLAFGIPVSGQSWSKYVITQKGQRNAEATRQMAGGIAAYIREIVRWVKALTFNELLRAIYANYPEFSVNSVFRG